MKFLNGFLFFFLCQPVHLFGQVPTCDKLERSTEIYEKKYKVNRPTKICERGIDCIKNCYDSKEAPIFKTWVTNCKDIRQGTILSDLNDEPQYFIPTEGKKIKYHWVLVCGEDYYQYNPYYLIINKNHISEI